MLGLRARAGSWNGSLVSGCSRQHERGQLLTEFAVGAGRPTGPTRTVWWMEPVLSAKGKTPSAVEIADALAKRGECVVRLASRPEQRLVDVHWTARRAGQLLGIKVKVYVEGPIRDVDPMMTITVIPRRHERWRPPAR